MFFASDNSGPVPPQVLTALAEANSGYAMGYGADAEMAEVTARIREILEAPEAAVFLVATGTAANALALSTLCQPFETIFCTPTAHIHEDECNAPEFYSGGAKLTLVPGAPGFDDKMTPEALRATIAKEETRGVHGPQRGPVSLTQVSERGTIYSLTELQALAAVTKEFNLPLHMDGARFANAMVALDCTPADMTWKVGVDAVSFGGTKNGLLGVEAVIFFDPKHAWEFELRRKRGGHLFSKHRYLSAQMLAYLTDDLWRDNAVKANDNCAYLAQGLRRAKAPFLHEPQANMIFAALPRATHQRLFDAGAAYHLWDGPLDGDPQEQVAARFVCDWAIEKQQIDQFLALITQPE
ncbi:threonine aldolase family protein [Pseudophaeobacter sp. TrK17]|uniref:threonine aldolase family protein n=1 Tax=Pseudophaeobacter sp. TrK17 TaxID=2815167 RepID=UPI0035CFABAD